MPALIEISDVLVRRPERPKKGVVAWASCVVSGAIRLDNLVVTRLGDGRLALGFPARFSRSGVKFPHIKPITAEARRALEDAILGELHAQWARNERKAGP